MRRSTWISISVLALGACSSTGNGTETDNPLVDFDHSACKAHGLETALVLAPDAGLTGDSQLCIDYEVDEGGEGAQLEVRNYASACGTDFDRATASFAHGRLKLTMHRDDCTVARCGGCLYDLSFRVTGPRPSTHLDVELHEAGCEGTTLEPERPLTFVIPAGEQSAGTICEPF